MVEDTDTVPCPSQASIVFLTLHSLEMNADMMFSCFLSKCTFINLIVCSASWAAVHIILIQVAEVFPVDLSFQLFLFHIDVSTRNSGVFCLFL